jgi:hypothetical protein
MMSSSTSRHTHGINKMYITDINNISQKEKNVEKVVFMVM